MRLLSEYEAVDIAAGRVVGGFADAAGAAAAGTGTRGGGISVGGGGPTGS